MRSEARTHSILRHDQLDVDRAMLLVIDIQEKILPLIGGPERVVTNSRKMIEAAQVLDIPVLVTEQYPKGLGHTVGALQAELHASKAQVIEKPAFSCWAEPAVREAMLTLDRTQVIVVGIETHVCVQQTVLDLLSRDYTTFVCADAVGGRGALNHSLSLDRMRHAGGVITTVEAVMFELCGRTDIPRFKPMLEIIKASPPVDS
ncbi:MAG: hydrolase [Planctomycetes bacterium]|nr:hydrolase [Planctomycetota bacterium]MBI3833947.1 hydrolase [Planctomycetota bacterium]